MDTNNKKELRKLLKEKRSKLSVNEIALYSSIIQNKLYETEEYINAEEILAYVSFSSEVGTHMLIEHAIRDGKKVAVPKVINKEYMEFYYINSVDELSEGEYGILEPKPLYPINNNSKQILLLPGIAFDGDKNRLGYGGGYYDKYLDTHESITTIMLAYEMEKQQRLPVEPWDKKADIIITEKTIYK